VRKLNQLQITKRLFKCSARLPRPTARQPYTRPFLTPTRSS